MVFLNNLAQVMGTKVKRKRAKLVDLWAQVEVIYDFAQRTRQKLLRHWARPGHWHDTFKECSALGIAGLFKALLDYSLVFVLSELDDAEQSLRNMFDSASFVSHIGDEDGLKKISCRYGGDTFGTFYCDPSDSTQLRVRIVARTRREFVAYLLWFAGGFMRSRMDHFFKERDPSFQLATVV